MLIQLSQTTFTGLSSSERVVINFINTHEQAVLNMSITNIARKTFTSAATVSRAIQKSGFAGIAQLRYQIGVENQRNDMSESPYQVNDILLKSFRECKKTIDNLPIGSILRVIQYINQANRICIYARGFTALIAEEFQQDLQLLGYNVLIIKDVTWMNNTEKFISSDDTVIIFTVRNTTPEIIDSAKKIHALGAKLVTCCCVSPTKLSNYSDVMLVGHSELIMHSHGFEVYSKVPLFIIARTLVEYLSNNQ